MGIPGRSLVRTHFACPTAAALLLLSAAGCGVIDPEAPPGTLARQEPVSAPASPSGIEHGGLVADASSPCAGVSLDARRSYRPRSWTDGDVTFVGGSLTFPIPSEIPVTAGASAKGRAQLSFSSGGGTSTTCVYRGNGDFGSGGLLYVFKRCRLGAAPENDDDADESDGPADPLPVAGSVVTADTFHLHVQRGDKHLPTTEIHLGLPGPVLSDDNACTTDTCDLVTGVVIHTPIALDDGNECTTDSCDVAAGPSHTPVDSVFCRGRANFHDRTLAGLGGNGRSCADCHMDSERFQLTPAAALARFNEMTTSGEDDPLFRPIDANDFRINGAAAHDYTNLTVNGLIRVTIPLPAERQAARLRAAVPCPATAGRRARPSPTSGARYPRSSTSTSPVPMALAPVYPRGPNRSGGYQLDGRIDTLQNQALGALRTMRRSPSTRRRAFWMTWRRSRAPSSPRRASRSSPTRWRRAPFRCPIPIPVWTRSRLRASLSSTGRAGSATATSAAIRAPARRSSRGRRARRLPHPLPRHRDRVSAAGRQRRLRRASCSQPCSPSQMANVRTYEITNSGVAPSGTPCGGARSPAGLRHAGHDVGSGPHAPHRLPGAPAARATSAL